MILENKNKAICVVPNYISDAPNPQLSEAEHFMNVPAVRNKETHHNLRSDLSHSDISILADIVGPQPPTSSDRCLRKPSPDLLPETLAGPAAGPTA
ncbi:hypothetical protein OSB04_020545 [Centaurea solstitialis]|uniref:Uncharacterized protein n=1 Tax=Centaurea solstitialis TaxID=347529 RepID=A0AA38W3Z8_9ASTR|nr:hypothetical protein OSB04_020545 [Centaurea solstitialis]